MKAHLERTGGESSQLSELLQARMTPFKSQTLNQSAAARAWPKHVKCLLGLRDRLWIVLSQDAIAVYHSGGESQVLKFLGSGTRTSCV